jgi:hypothetical protein
MPRTKEIPGQHPACQQSSSKAPDEAFVYNVLAGDDRGEKRP